jgi:hypothetical protein
VVLVVEWQRLAATVLVEIVLTQVHLEVATLFLVMQVEHKVKEFRQVLEEVLLHQQVLKLVRLVSKDLSLVVVAQQEQQVHAQVAQVAQEIFLQVVQVQLVLECFLEVVEVVLG